MPIEQTGNVYHDTEHRYFHDATFHAAVKMLEAAAERHGFTPGELKQIAFKAALNIEERRLYHRGLTIEELQPGEVPVEPPVVTTVAGYLKDGTPVFYGRAP